MEIIKHEGKYYTIRILGVELFNNKIDNRFSGFYIIRSYFVSDYDHNNHIYTVVITDKNTAILYRKFDSDINRRKEILYRKFNHRTWYNGGV